MWQVCAGAWLLPHVLQDFVCRSDKRRIAQGWHGVGRSGTCLGEGAVRLGVRSWTRSEDTRGGGGWRTERSGREPQSGPWTEVWPSVGLLDGRQR